MSLRADAGQQQQLRGSDRARGQYDLSPAGRPAHLGAHAVLHARATSVLISTRCTSVSVSTVRFGAVQRGVRQAYSQRAECRSSA